MRLLKNEVLVIRTCNSDYTSYNGFKWPKLGHVCAPDWEPTYECGHGLHGLLWGAGGTGYLSGGDNAIWQVIKVRKADLLFGQGVLIDKCKFKEGFVVYSGNRLGAVSMIQKYAPKSTPVVFATQTDGDHSTQTAGDYSGQTAGNNSTQLAGDYSTQVAGDNSNQTAGNNSTQVAGVGTVQIILYRKNYEHRVKTRIITKETANKPYKFNHEIEDWVLVD